MQELSDLDIQEIILDLKRLQKDEEQLKLESNALFNATNVLNSSDDIDEVLVKLMLALRHDLSFEDAMLITKKDDDFTVVSATNEDYMDIEFRSGDLFNTVLSNIPIISHDVSLLSEWENISKNLAHIKSALHLPIIGKRMKSILICVHSDYGHFSAKHENIALKLGPVTKRAILNLEKQQELKEEIKKRNLAEEELKSIQNKLVDNAYKEGFAEHAVSVLHNIGNLVTPLKVKTDLFKDYLLDEDIQVLDYLKNKLTEHSDEESQKILKALDIIVKSLNEKNTTIYNYLNYNRDQLNKISTTIVAQQKYADLTNKTKKEILLSDMFNEILETYQDALVRFNISIFKNIKSKVSIYVEPNGAHHTFVNFISNSIDAIEERLLSGEKYSPKIHIDAHEEDDSIKISIKDNGIGIEDADDRIFNYGYTTKHKGSGFGLHSCANFIHSHNGNIHLESEGKNQGLNIQIILPKKEGLV